MSKELRDALALLEEDIAMLRQWASECRSGGWSTHQVRPMEDRASLLHDRVNALKGSAHNL